VEEVGCWLRTRRRTRPLAVHPGWRVDLDSACAVVMVASGHVRAPEPLRRHGAQPDSCAQAVRTARRYSNICLTWLFWQDGSQACSYMAG
jgi:hypothetical protein